MSVVSQVGTLPNGNRSFFKLSLTGVLCCADYMDEEKHDEYVSELAETFKTFGTILTTEVRIRDKYEDGQRKVSWGLVSFNNEVSAQRAVAECASLGKPDWVVKVRISFIFLAQVWRPVGIYSLKSWDRIVAAPLYPPHNVVMDCCVCCR